MTTWHYEVIFDKFQVMENYPNQTILTEILGHSLASDWPAGVSINTRFKVLTKLQVHMH